MIEDNFFQLELGSASSDDNRFQPFADDTTDVEPKFLWQLQRGRTVGYKDLAYKGDVLAAVTIERDLNRYFTVREINNSYAIWFAMLSGMALGLYIVFYSLEYFFTNKSF